MARDRGGWTSDEIFHPGASSPFWTPRAPGPAGARPGCGPGAPPSPPARAVRRRPSGSPGGPAAAAPAHGRPALRTPRACELQRALNRLTGGRLSSLILTDNRRTILSVQPGRPGDRTQLSLRIHRSFVGAPPEVLQAVAAFLESRKGSDRSREALTVIRQHFAAHRPGRRSRRAALRPEGVAYDLREIVDDLNQRYFGDRLSVGVTWGRSSGGAAHHCRRRRTSSLQLGKLLLRGPSDPSPRSPRPARDPALRHRSRHLPRAPARRHASGGQERPAVLPHPGVPAQRTRLPAPG